MRGLSFSFSVFHVFFSKQRGKPKQPRMAAVAATFHRSTMPLVVQVPDDDDNDSPDFPDAPDVASQQLKRGDEGLATGTIAMGTIATGTTMENRSAAAASPTTTTTASVTTTRYTTIRTLQRSLFGQVDLVFDALLKIDVAIKISRAALATPKSTTTNGTTSALARSPLSQLSLLEDVRREACTLRLLMGGPDQPAFGAATIDVDTCGLSQIVLRSIHASSSSSSLSSSGGHHTHTRQQCFLDGLQKGQRYIVTLLDSVETRDYHYLISEYVGGGDLYSVLSRQPQSKVSEDMARYWFHSLCCGVSYLHAHSIAHLDLSLENVCMHENKSIRLVDFGLATQHPLYCGNRQQTTTTATTTMHNTSSQYIRLVREPVLHPLDSGPPNLRECRCPTCVVSGTTLMASDPAIDAARKCGALGKLRYLCRPVCGHVNKPGKSGYMSPELRANQCWDAFAQDVFGLGVILFMMLTWRPPFRYADPTTDAWFRFIHTGKWLLPNVRSQESASIYNTLSPNALDLIDSLMKPQHLRPTADLILCHPWFDPKHPGSSSNSSNNKVNVSLLHKHTRRQQQQKHPMVADVASDLRRFHTI